MLVAAVVGAGALLDGDGRGSAIIETVTRVVVLGRLPVVLGPTENRISASEVASPIGDTKAEVNGISLAFASQ